MIESERNLIQQTLAEMRDLRADLSGFRGEMVEFKTSVKERIGQLTAVVGQCQSHPETCANARRLDEHLKKSGGLFGHVFTVLGFCLAAAGLLLSISIAVRGGN